MPIPVISNCYLIIFSAFAAYSLALIRTKTCLVLKELVLSFSYCRAVQFSFEPNPISKSMVTNLVVCDILLKMQRNINHCSFHISLNLVTVRAILVSQSENHNQETSLSGTICLNYGNQQTVQSGLL